MMANIPAIEGYRDVIFSRALDGLFRSWFGATVDAAESVVEWDCH